MVEILAGWISRPPLYTRSYLVKLVEANSKACLFFDTSSERVGKKKRRAKIKGYQIRHHRLQTAGWRPHWRCWRCSVAGGDGGGAGFKPPAESVRVPAESATTGCLPFFSLQLFALPDMRVSYKLLTGYYYLDGGDNPYRLFSALDTASSTRAGSNLDETVLQQNDKQKWIKL